MITQFLKWYQRSYKIEIIIKEIKNTKNDDYKDILQFNENWYMKRY